MRGSAAWRTLLSLAEWAGHRKVWETEDSDDSLEVVLLAIWLPRESHSCFMVSPVVKLG